MQADPTLPFDQQPTLKLASISTTVSGSNRTPAARSTQFKRPGNTLIPFLPTKPAEKTSRFVNFHQPIVPLREIYESQWPVTETTYLTIGGGIGSFSWVDHLLICGVPPEHVIALGLEPKPFSRLQRMACNSQIPGYERLRSNSDACPDNIWGWPSYGLREIWQSLKEGQFGHAIRIAMQIFGEPVLADTYTPRADAVYGSLEQEAHRIGWERIWRYGWARTLRKTDDGRYVVAYSQINQQGEEVQQFIVASYVHLAMGYPGIQILPEVLEYRQCIRDVKQVANAYEEHDHVYEHLLQYGGVVIVRGRGIVASRVIQRLYEVRTQNERVMILHVHRSPLSMGHRDHFTRRRVEHHIELQPFNWPKASWTGTLRFQLERADDQKREQLLNDWGGTTTADRKEWRHILRLGLQEGWYQIYFGQVLRIERTAQGKMLVYLSIDKPNQLEMSLTANFMIDCTGLETALNSNPFLRDMVDCYQLGRSPKDRLRVGNDFEVQGMSNGQGRVYAGGSATLGGPLAGVDSFLGLQYAAFSSVEALAALQAPWVHRLTPFRSFVQWIRWVRGVRP
jgi:pSer/pThr/pTyr-binding forkhead associated (FHA) protein